MSRKFNNFFSLDSSYRFLSNTLEEACKSGNISLAKEAILRGARNLETAFQVASEKGHIFIVKFLLSFDKRFLKTTDSLTSVATKDDAAANNETDANDKTDLAFSKIRNQNNFKCSLIYAWTMSCRYNHLRLAKLLVTDYAITEKTAISAGEVYHVLKYVVHYGNIELLEWYLSRHPDSAKLFYGDPDRYLPMACSGDSVNSLAMVKLLISKGAQNICHGLSYACLKSGEDFICDYYFTYNDNRYRIIVYLLSCGGASQYWQELYDNYINHKRLVENGLPLDNLKSINKTLFREISKRRYRVAYDASQYLITDLCSIVGSYVID